MANKKDKDNQPRPQQPELTPEPEEEIIEIVDESEEEIIEVVDEAEPQPAAGSARSESGVNLGASPDKLADGSDVIEVDEAEIEFVEEEPKPAPPPPGARPRPQPTGKKEGLGKKDEEGPKPPTVPPVKRAAPTSLAPKQAQSTQLAPSKQAQPTQLAPTDKGQPTQLAPKQAQPTQLASPKQAQPTQLAPSGEAMDLTDAPTDAAGVDQGTTQAGFPNLSVDEPDQAEEAHDVLEVIEEGEITDVIEVGQEDSAVGKKESSSGIDPFDLEEELLIEGSSSVLLDRPPGDKPSGVDIIAEQLESQVGMVPSGEEAEDLDEEEIVHELEDSDESSAVDLSTAAGTPPVPIEVGDDLLATEGETEVVGEEAGKKKSGEPVDITQPFFLEGERPATEEGVVIDESLLVDEAEKAEADDIADMLDLEQIDKSGKKAASEDDDFLAAAEAEAEGIEADESVTAAVDEEEDQSVAVAATQGKADKKKKKADKEAKPKKPGQPGSLGRMLAGAGVGLLLAFLAFGAVWFLAPDLLGQLRDASPNAKAPPKPLPTPTGPQVSDLQLALEHMNNEEFDQALNLVNDATPEEKDKLAVRGQAQWLKYLKDQAEKNEPLNKDADEVKAALKDLETAEKDLLKKQIMDTLAKEDLAKNLGQFAKTDKALRDLLITEKILDPKDAMANPAKSVADLITTKKTLDQGIMDLAKQKTDLETKIDQMGKVESAVKKMLVDKKVVPADDPLLNDMSKAIAKALQERENLTGTLTMINEKLKDAKVTEKDVKGVESLLALRDKFEKDVTDFQKAAAEALKTIHEGKPLPADADLKKELVEGASILSEKAKAPLVNSLGKVVGTFRDISAGTSVWLQEAIDKTVAEAQVKFFEAREPLIETPEKKVDTWLSLFHNHGYKGSVEMDKARKDAGWIASAESKSTPEARAKAVYLQALLARNQEQFDEARKLLGEAIKQAGTLEPEPAWKERAARVLEELTDAPSYFLPTARKLHQQGEYPQAIEQLNVGLKALPDNPHLLLERATIQFKMLPADAKSAPEQVQAVRMDAESAKKGPATAPEAHFVLGQLEERLGKLNNAMAMYEQALALAPADSKQDISRYQQAIGRLLLIDPALIPTGSSSADGTEAGGLLPENATGEQTASTISPWATLALLAVTAGELEGGDLEPDDPKLQKLIDLAAKYKASDDPKLKGQGYMLMGLALSQQGKRTQGLKSYAEGLKLYYPGIESEHLQTLVETHPAFLVPDSLAQPNPTLAEAHFGEGVHLYFDGKYAAAELQFLKAIKYHKNDARYHYYLGLSQYAQKTKEKEIAARHNIEFGTTLEVQDLPSEREISLSLERIQGPLRQYLNKLKTEAKLVE